MTRPTEHDKHGVQAALGEARDKLAQWFGDEAFAQRLAAARQGLDVALAAVDALFHEGGRLSEEATRRLGAKAAAEANGEVVDDVNVATPVGDKAEALPQLPDPNETAILEHDKPYIPPGTQASVAAGQEPDPAKG